MVGSDSPSRPSALDRLTTDAFDRRSVLKSIGTWGVGAVAGLGVTTTASDPVRADSDVGAYDHDDDVVSQDSGEAQVGGELGVSGPQHTHVQTNELSFCWGISADQNDHPSDIVAENISVTFTQDGTNPEDHAADNVQPYSQGTQEANTELIQFALDTMWELTEVPTPNPLDVDQDDGPSVTPGTDLDSFTVDYAGRVTGDATGGADFTLDLGTSGFLETGFYHFDCTLTADVVYEGSARGEKDLGDLVCHCNVPIEVRD